MNYIIFDLEWNQCPKGKEYEIKALPFEILEIGAVKLNSEYKELDRFSRYIRPVVYQSMHFRTQEILHMDLPKLKQAPFFSQVLKEFIAWCGTDVYFCTWGSLDLFELQRNLTYHGMENPFLFPLYYLDIQKIFSILYDDGKSRRSLEHAADFLGIKKKLSFHDALSDSVYTAEILKKMPSSQLLKHYSIDYYRTPRNRKEEIYAVFDHYCKFVSKEFSSKTEAMKDRKVTSTKCYLCYKSSPKKILWFASGNHNYFSLSYCPEHGWLKGKIRIRKNRQGKFFCIKTLKLVPPEEAEVIRERKQKTLQ